MNKAEAAALIASLVAAFPGARFAVENAEMYESGIADLDAKETQFAIGELIHSERFLPSVASIRQEVVRLRRLRVAKADNERLRLSTGDGSTIGPCPAEWREPLSRLLELQARHRRMAESWYAERAKPMPGDPVAAFAKIATDGAAGHDVRERFKRDVIHDDSERRYP